MAFTVEQSARLEQIRGLILQGKGTPELSREGVELMRGDRKAAQASSTTSRTKAAEGRAVPDTGSILAALKAKGAALQGAVIPAKGN